MTAQLYLLPTRGKMTDDGKLDRLREIAHRCAAECRVLLKYDTVEQRRACWLEYGQTLLAIKKLIPNKNEFNDYIKQQQLDVRDASLRSDVMWMAENWSDLLARASQCPHANPRHIRQWIGEQAGTRKPSKRKTAQSINDEAESDEAESDKAESESDVVESNETGSDHDKFGRGLAGLWTAIGDAAVNANNLQILLTKDSTLYDQFKQSDFDRIFDAWDKLVKRINRIRR